MLWRRAFALNFFEYTDLSAAWIGTRIRRIALPRKNLMEESLGYLQGGSGTLLGHRYDFAQTICPPGFYEMLPPMRTPLEGLYMADASYYYPEDRSISESLAAGRTLAQTAMQSAP